MVWQLTNSFLTIELADHPRVFHVQAMKTRLVCQTSGFMTSPLPANHSSASWPFDRSKAIMALRITRLSA